MDSKDVGQRSTESVNQMFETDRGGKMKNNSVTEKLLVRE